MQEIIPMSTQPNDQTFIVTRRQSNRRYSVSIPKMIGIKKSMNAAILSVSISSTQIFCSALNHRVCLPYGDKREVLFYQIPNKGKEIAIAIFDLDEFKADQTIAIPCDAFDSIAARFYSDCEYVGELFLHKLTKDNLKNFALRISMSVGNILLTMANSPT